MSAIHFTSCRYEYISPETLKAAREAGEILYEGSDRDETGKKIDIFFTRNNLIDRKEPSLFMSDGSSRRKLPSDNRDIPYLLYVGPPTLVNVLSASDKINAFNIWISLQTKTQFIEKATRMMKKEALLEKKKDNSDTAVIAKKSAEKVVTVIT